MFDENIENEANYIVPVNSATPGKIVDIFRVEDDDDYIISGSKDTSSFTK